MLGCHRGGRLVGSYRGRDAASNWNVAVRVHTRIGLDDKHLADWPHITGQGSTGELQIVLSIGPSTSAEEECQGLQLCQERCVEIHQIVSQALHEDESNSEFVKSNS